MNQKLYFRNFTVLIAMMMFLCIGTGMGAAGLFENVA